MKEFKHRHLYPHRISEAIYESNARVAIRPQGYCLALFHAIWVAETETWVGGIFVRNVTPYFETPKKLRAYISKHIRKHTEVSKK